MAGDLATEQAVHADADEVYDAHDISEISLHGQLLGTGVGSRWATPR